MHTSRDSEIEMEIGWGDRPRLIRVPTGTRRVCAPTSPPAGDFEELIDKAVSMPIGSKPLMERLRQASTVCVLIPDETRKDVFGPVWPHLAPLLKNKNISIGIAAGKHKYISPPGGLWRHDVKRTDLVSVGRTTRGTPVSYPPEVLHADLRILIGEIRPHYFAGYAGGAKTLFPGVAGASGIWSNHELKAEPGARLGRVQDNPCRMDMEEAASLAGPSFIINVIRSSDGSVIDIVAGDPVRAHREGVRRARPLFECSEGTRAQVVVVSDQYPVTMNLYQACKLLPPAGAMLKEGGTIVLAAECGHGIGPVDVINEGIYRLGSVHSLPRKHRVVLVSRRSPIEVKPTFAEYADSVERVLEGIVPSEIIVMPYGGEIVPVVSGRTDSK